MNTNNSRQLTYYSQSEKDAKPIARVYSLTSGVYGIQWEGCRFSESFPLRWLASFLTFCIENSGERMKARHDLLREEGGHVCGSVPAKGCSKQAI